MEKCPATARGLPPGRPITPSLSAEDCTRTRTFCCRDGAYCREENKNVACYRGEKAMAKETRFIPPIKDGKIKRIFDPRSLRS